MKDPIYQIKNVFIDLSNLRSVELYVELHYHVGLRLFFAGSIHPLNLMVSHDGKQSDALELRDKLIEAWKAFKNEPN